MKITKEMCERAADEILAIAGQTKETVGPFAYQVVCDSQCGAMQAAMAVAPKPFMEDDGRPREHTFPLSLRLGCARRFVTGHGTEHDKEGWYWEAEYTQGSGYCHPNRAAAVEAALHAASQSVQLPHQDILDDAQRFRQLLERGIIAKSLSGDHLHFGFFQLNDWQGKFDHRDNHRAAIDLQLAARHDRG